MVETFGMHLLSPSLGREETLGFSLAEAPAGSPTTTDGNPGFACPALYPSQLPEGRDHALCLTASQCPVHPCSVLNQQ